MEICYEVSWGDVERCSSLQMWRVENGKHLLIAGSVNPADPRPLRKFETLLLPPGVFHLFPDQNLCGFELWIYEFICHVCLNNGAHRAQKKSLKNEALKHRM